jgi:hypothetical protein
MRTVVVRRYNVQEILVIKRRIPKTTFTGERVLMNKVKFGFGLCMVMFIISSLAAPTLVYAQDAAPTATPDSQPVSTGTDTSSVPTDALLVATDGAIAIATPIDLSTSVEATTTSSDVTLATPEPSAIIPVSLTDITAAIVDQAATINSGDPSGVLGAGTHGAPAGAAFQYYKAGGANPVNGTCNYDSGTNIVTCYWDLPIQTAINDAAVGSTVSVEAGDYTEQLKIDKSLTLQGLGNPVIHSPVTLTNTMPAVDGSGNPVVLHPIIFVNNADGVVIDGFTVDGDGHGNSNYRFVGIGYFNSSGTISNTTVTGITDTPVGGMQGGLGIYGYVNDSTPTTLNVENNTVTDYQKGGMVFKGTGLTVNTTGNTITGYGPVPFIAQNGIQYSQGAGGTIQDNTISGNWYSGTSATSAGIILYNNPAAITIDHNTLTNDQVGVSAANSGALTITDNTITGSTTGISESHWSGTLFGLIEENTITGNTTGIYSDAPGVVVHFNNLTSNTTGLRFEDSFATGGTLDATSNYWGCPQGASLNPVGPVPAGCQIVLGNVNVNPSLGYPAGVTDHIEITSGDAQSTLINTAFANPLIVHVVDANGLDVENAGVNFIVPSSGSSANLSAYSLITDENGTAVVTAAANGLSGSYTVMVTSGDARTAINLTNLPQPSEGITQPPAPVTFVVPVTGGQFINLSCQASTTLELEEGIKLTFNAPLCQYTASLNSEQETTLPTSLPSGDAFKMGATYQLRLGDAAVKVLPVGISATLSFPKPVDLLGTSTVLFWDVRANNGTGAWVELPKLGALSTGDDRVVIQGLFEQDGRLFLVTNFTGTFILVSK